MTGNPTVYPIHVFRCEAVFDAYKACKKLHVSATEAVNAIGIRGHPRLAGYPGAKTVQSA